MNALNAHEIAVLVIAVIAFLRTRIVNAAGQPRVDNWTLVIVAVALSEGLSFLVGGETWRPLALRGVQVLVEAVGGTAFLGELAKKTGGAAPVAAAMKDEAGK